jgi:hypothetical protein
MFITPQAALDKCLRPGNCRMEGVINKISGKVINSLIVKYKKKPGRKAGLV